MSSEAILGAMVTIALSACGAAFFLARNHPRVCIQIATFLRDMSVQITIATSAVLWSAYMMGSAIKGAVVSKTDQQIGAQVRQIIDATMDLHMKSGWWTLGVALGALVLAVTSIKLAEMFIAERAVMEPSKRVRGQAE